MAASVPIEPTPEPVMRQTSVHVSIPLFPECDPSIIYGVYDTLWAAGRPWDNVEDPTASGLFEPRLVAVDDQPLRLFTGTSVVPQDAIASVHRTDVVFIPNVIIGPSQSPRILDRRLIEWIKRMHRQGAHLYATCGGAIVLAETGLLDGHEATTHWLYEPVFRKYYPKVKLRIERILVQAGPTQSLCCGGGASSWQDLALLLVAKHGGTEEAIRISKLFLYQWHRHGQLPYASMSRNVNHGDAAILHCQQWIAEHYQRPDVIAALVRESGLPKRSFDRRFRAATGYSPFAYVQMLRIEEAKQMLETSSLAVEQIGREVGYEDSSSFRRLFRKLTGLPPKDYRRNFQPPSIVAGGVAERTTSRNSQGREAARPAIRP